MTTAGFAGEGPAYVPPIVPRLRDEPTDGELGVGGPAEPEPQEASAEDLVEGADVVAHLDDPEIEEAIEHLRPPRA